MTNCCLWFCFFHCDTLSQSYFSILYTFWQIFNVSMWCHQVKLILTWWLSIQVFYFADILFLRGTPFDIQGSMNVLGEKYFTHLMMRKHLLSNWWVNKQTWHIQINVNKNMGSVKNHKYCHICRLLKKRYPTPSSIHPIPCSILQLAL